MSFDHTRLTRGDVIAAAGAVALFITLFLPWYGVVGGNRTRFLLIAGGKTIPATGTAWEAYSTIILLLLALIVAGLAMAALVATGRTAVVPSAPQFVGLYGSLVAVVVAYRILEPPGGAQNKFNDVEYGAYLGFAAVLLIILGAVLASRERSAGAGGPQAAEA
jgi:hypothetical protein